MTDQSGSHGAEVKRGERFEFGKNWTRFLNTLNDEKIAAAEQTLRAMLEVDTLAGKRFIDIGSGSGLSSLAAHRLGATVTSFDFDPYSVACTRELKRRYCSDSDRWAIDEGSALDSDYLKTLGTFDVVYSWGVLHHTGRMWAALGNVHPLVAPGGILYIAIYNDQGSRSVRWRWIKKTYNRLPRILRSPYAAAVIAPSEFKNVTLSVLRGRFSRYINYAATGGVNPRGMTRWRDALDWVGGYPFEVATPEAIFDFYRKYGFVLKRLHCGGVGDGCNEFVFAKPN